LVENRLTQAPLGAHDAVGVMTMFSEPAPGDVLIRDGSLTGEFVILDAQTRRRLQGPFPSLREAADAARVLRARCSVWHEAIDARGRVLGRPVRLPMDNRQAI
jgi:hypothetical protein